MKNSNIFPIWALGMIFLFLLSACAPKPVDEDSLKQFSSMADLQSFLEERSSGSSGYFGSVGRAESMETTALVAAPTTAKDSADDFSTTNIQVEGVDEADFVKNDGKNIYVVSGNKIAIVEAYPAEDAEIVSEIEFKDLSISEIFINDDKLVVFGHENIQLEQADVKCAAGERCIQPYPRYKDVMFVRVFDVSDRSNPELSRNLEIDGRYINSRMIGNQVYVISQQGMYYRDDQPIPVPLIAEGTSTKTTKEISASDIYYFDEYDYSYMLTTVMSLDLTEDGGFETMSILMGYSQNIFVSQDNIYITYMKTLSPIYYQELMIEKVFIASFPKNIADQIKSIQDSDIDSFEKNNKMQEAVEKYTGALNNEEKQELEQKMQVKMAEVEQEIAKETQKTVIHRISIDDGDIKHEASGTAPGRALNQFSMDEYDDHFRIATTVGGTWGRFGQSQSTNNVYVLDMDMDIVGSVEDLAPGESIYSVRFLGEKAYMVTFKKVDPLFVIDLSDPENPEVLGKLKIPGYSDYLHPYDENHVIGVGKEAVAADQGDFGWYQGVKIALFDVSDVNNPREVAKVEIGDRGTDSYALHDHKAFLFSKSKNLLVIPILLAEIDEDKYADGIPQWQYGDYTWQGAYVFSLSPEEGFDLKGTITHLDDDAFKKSGYYWNSPLSVKRSLYMDDVLYTISDSMIKMNSLDNPEEEINSVKLPYEREQHPYPVLYEEPMI